MNTTLCTETAPAPMIDFDASCHNLYPRRASVHALGADLTLYVDDESFQDPDAAERYWGPGAMRVPVNHYRLAAQVHDDDQPEPQRMASAALSVAQERFIFLRYNYAKYRLCQARRQGQRRGTYAWNSRARWARAQIIHANLALVPVMAQRAINRGVDFDDLLSEGYLAVMRCVEKFDVSRGYKFSTYACRSILASFSRLQRKARTVRKYIICEFDPEFEGSDHPEAVHDQQRCDAIETVREVLAANSANLNSAEMEVILKRFPFGGADKGQTLAQVGSVLGLSPESIRQIEKRSLAKIRAALEKVFAA
ncbi:MAG: sigma-70 family RNA polymerase sigma factor [Planctomycetaceae bacterium]|nr:sigma-70 family RNA polymerase sigma factor [Planctomycetaceae bacterium]